AQATPALRSTVTAANQARRGVVMGQRSSGASSFSILIGADSGSSTFTRLRARRADISAAQMAGSMGCVIETIAATQASLGVEKLVPPPEPGQRASGAGLSRPGNETMDLSACSRRHKPLKPAL